MSSVIQDYYNQNAEREWGRPDTPLSKIEFASALYLIDKYFPHQGSVCDIGSGPGRYAIEMIRKGYAVTLFDLSEASIQIARDRLAELNLTARALIVGDARDLAQLGRAAFHAVLLMGPMYHLIEKSDRGQVLQQVLGILKPGGFALITYLNAWGLVRTGMTDFPGWYQDINVLRSMQEEHCFPGRTLSGFTECYWSTPEIAIREVEEAGFKVISYGGAQGFAGGMRPILEQLAQENPAAYANVVQVAAEWCERAPYRDSTEHLHLVVQK